MDAIKSSGGQNNKINQAAPDTSTLPGSQEKQGENKQDPSQAPDRGHTGQFPFSPEQFIEVLFPEQFKKLLPEYEEWDQLAKVEAGKEDSTDTDTPGQFPFSPEQFIEVLFPEQFKGLLLPDHLKGAKGWEEVKGELEQEQRKSDKGSQSSDTHGERGIETVAQPESSPAQTKPSPTETWLIILPFALLAVAALLLAYWRSKSKAARAMTIHGSGRTAGYPRPTGGVDSSKLKPKKRTATAEAPTRSGEVAPVTGRKQRVDESPKKDTSFQTHRMRETIQACDEENLRLLLEDRLDEVDDDKADLEKQARDVALLLDEIHGLETPYAGKPDGVVLARLADDLKAELRACDCELLDSDVWNPDIQRAVRVEPTDEPLEHPIILAKQALGVKVRGRLVRKQEVKIKKYIPS
ncbi:MAG TPA: hypothetical protein H9862_06880 [Candidatus Akkermansia intestinigallinarum]|uniref:Uncharacterized protein n=1 Tax=Candidatus Akkermansia intestinigallinarum TaxID=2838431 RepID=A0A9D1VBX4_9BACT|nr:hypothetical protein [Candidatus Akkermansia intestinigallinarum]